MRRYSVVRAADYFVLRVAGSALQRKEMWQRVVVRTAARPIATVSAGARLHPLRSLRRPGGVCSIGRHGLSRPNPLSARPHATLASPHGRTRPTAATATATAAGAAGASSVAQRLLPLRGAVQRWLSSATAASDAAAASAAAPNTASATASPQSPTPAPAPSDGGASKPAAKPTSLYVAYRDLVKLRLSSGVLFSTVATGFISAMAFGPNASPVLDGALCLLGTYSCIAGANAYNQLWEIERDRKMRRTANRPLCTGRVSVSTGLAIATAHSVVGPALLACVNLPLAIIGAANIALYVLAYTPLKPRSSWNTAVGAVVGALPPVMGVAAAFPAAYLASVGTCTGLITVLTHPYALWCFAYQFAWQMIHFLPMQVMGATAPPFTAPYRMPHLACVIVCAFAQYTLRDDYRAGGYKMMSLTDEFGVRSARHTLVWMGLMSAVGFVPPLIDFASPMFLLTMGTFHAAGMLLAWRFVRATTALPQLPAATAATLSAEAAVAEVSRLRRDGAKRASRHMQWYSYVVLVAVYTLLLVHLSPLKVSADSGPLFQATAQLNHALARFCAHSRIKDYVDNFKAPCPYTALQPKPKPNAAAATTAAAAPNTTVASSATTNASAPAAASPSPAK